MLLGIGINVNLARDDIPAELRATATSIRVATGAQCDRIALASALFSRLNNRYMEAESRGFRSAPAAVGAILGLDGNAG